jgi:sugar lactone lactonase YvrE
MAFGPGGVLYIADSGRNQIVERIPDGAFRVIAGTGKSGFSGDGGPAIDARLDDPAGIIVDRGTLYFADEGNNRVRAIAPDGTITTVAGNGRTGWAAGGRPALTTPLTSPTAVTIGPKGSIYVAVEGYGEVLRIEATGTLTRIAGTRGRGVGFGHAATVTSAGGPTGIAFDRQGDLFIAGFDTKSLRYVTPRGIMRQPSGPHSDYPTPGGLITTPDGRIFATDHGRILSVSRSGARPIVSLAGRSIDGIRGFSPNGVAVASNGAIYADTGDNGWANAQALITIAPNGHIDLLWKSSTS